MCGASETYAMFVFPQQIPLQVYIQVSWGLPQIATHFLMQATQAFPEVMNFLNKVKWADLNKYATPQALMISV